MYKIFDIINFISIVRKYEEISFKELGDQLLLSKRSIEKLALEIEYIGFTIENLDSTVLFDPFLFEKGILRLKNSERLLEFFRSKVSNFVKII
jgi:hypothetical protein